MEVSAPRPHGGPMRPCLLRIIEVDHRAGPVQHNLCDYVPEQGRLSSAGRSVDADEPGIGKLTGEVVHSRLLHRGQWKSPAQGPAGQRDQLRCEGLVQNLRLSDHVPAITGCYTSDERTEGAADVAISSSTPDSRQILNEETVQKLGFRGLVDTSPGRHTHEHRSRLDLVLRQAEGGDQPADRPIQVDSRDRLNLTLLIHPDKPLLDLLA